jgi:hypothetical protein
MKDGKYSLSISDEGGEDDANKPNSSRKRLWRDQLSPKIKALLSNIPASDNTNSIKYAFNQPRLLQDASVLEWQEKIVKLNEPLASKDQTIVDLEAKIEEQEKEVMLPQLRHPSPGWTKDRLSLSPTPTTSSNFELEDRISRLESELLSEINLMMPIVGQRGDCCRESLDSVKRNSNNDLIAQLKSELESKRSEIDVMRREHEFELSKVTDKYTTELFERDEDVIVMTKPTTISKGVNTDNNAQVEALTSSLNNRTEECLRIRSSSLDDLSLACNKAINYMHEEVDSFREQERLRRELEVTRLENYELKAELKRLKEKDCTVSDQLANNDLEAELTQVHKDNENGSSTVFRNDDAWPSTPPVREKTTTSYHSPLPTIETWNNVCRRIRNALKGSEEPLPEKAQLDPNGKIQANNLMEELCFAREGAPNRVSIDTNDDDNDDGILVDAFSVASDYF